MSKGLVLTKKIFLNENRLVLGTLMYNYHICKISEFEKVSKTKKIKKKWKKILSRKGLTSHDWYSFPAEYPVTLPSY